MIDLHIHTCYSDGSDTVEEVLKMCEKQNLEYISITDHDTCKQYEDKALKENRIYSGTIIQGTELHAVFQDKSIEILAYNIDTKIMKTWLKKYYAEAELERQQKIFYRKLLDICDKHHIIYDETKIEKTKSPADYVEYAIYNEIISYPENHKILGEFAESFSSFFRKGLANPESSYFMNHIEFRPPYKEVIDIIHRVGGKAFLAHPFEYKFEDTIGFIDELRREEELDGIECFHSSTNKEERDILCQYAETNKLLQSGGSDYHGSTKPDLQIGIGRGDLNISKNILKNWER